jgi:hypothetical protein
MVFFWLINPGENLSWCHCNAKISLWDRKIGHPDSHDMDDEVMQTNDVKDITIEGLKILTSELLGGQYQMSQCFQLRK